MTITHETLLENGWTYDPETGRYVTSNDNPIDENLVLFLSANYGINNDYRIKLIKAEHDFVGETVQATLNCMTMEDLKVLKYLFYEASAVGKVKRLLINY